MIWNAEIDGKHIVYEGDEPSCDRAQIMANMIGRFQEKEAAERFLRNLKNDIFDIWDR